MTITANVKKTGAKPPKRGRSKPRGLVGPKLLSVDDTAVALGLCRSAVERLLNGGFMRSVFIGRRRLIHIDEIERIARDGVQFESAAAGGRSVPPV
jgi:excisionase family DNA binding protein